MISPTASVQVIVSMVLLEELERKCWEMNINWVVDADVSGFFDNLDHGILREFIQKRVNDGGIKRLIGKWLNAGVVEKRPVDTIQAGHAAGWGDLTTAGKYLPSLCVGRMVCTRCPATHAGSLFSRALCRRFHYRL